MGIALGCIGMNLRDFERCTPSEFKAVYDCWKSREESSERGKWERVRMQCLCSLQPYSKKSLQASDIMEFPWEKEEEKVSPRISNDELLERYKAAKKRFGLL